MAKELDFIKLFGLEGMLTKRTLLNETASDVANKTPNDSAQDIRVLLDELNIRVCSHDIDGVSQCLNAIQLRLDFMQATADQIKKGMGRK